MISPEKNKNATYALHGVLIKARSLAYQPGSDREVASILDRAEVLTKLFGSESDETAAFRKILENVAKSHQCNFVLERFDTDKPWDSI